MNDVSKVLDVVNSNYAHASWACLDDEGRLRVEVVPRKRYRWTGALMVFVSGIVIACVPVAAQSGSLSPASWMPLLSQRSFIALWTIGMLLWTIIISGLVYAGFRYMERRLIEHGPALECANGMIIINPWRGKVSELPLGGKIMITRSETKPHDEVIKLWGYAYRTDAVDVDIATLRAGSCSFSKAVEKFSKLAGVPMESIDLGRQISSKSA